MKTEWKVRQIEDVTFIQEGPGIRKYEYEEGGFPMINVRCVQDGYIDMSSARAANTELATGKWKHFQVDAGDILFTISGTIGRCAIVQESDLPLLMNTSVVRFRPTVPELDSRFLYLFLQSEGFQEPLKLLSSGTAIRNVGPTHIKTLSIPLPPLEEQQRIVAVLDEAFEGLARAREHAEVNLRNARELFESFLGKVFSEGSWPTRTLNQISENLDRVRVPITKGDRKAGDIPYYGASGVVDHVADHLFDEDLLLVADHNAWRERFGAVEFETDGGKWELRYYQHNAVNAALEALAKGDKRILLTLATGTGKTSIAFQIAWKLFQAKWNLTGEPVRRPRILFLADRNILADQAYNAFSAFPNDAVTRIDPDTIRKNGGKPPRNASLFFTIFQTFMTGEEEPAYKQYAPDFFDFIVIDECHRGGAKDESEWRRLLEYFEPAAQLGLTATPKRKHNADTYAYFGEPVYTYALRDGIEDGFLTPFKVRQMASTIDEYVYDSTDDVIAGEIEEGEIFTESDFNTRIIIEERELSRVKEFMGQIDQRQKTLVFCATQRHAALVRDLINQVKDGTNPNYCHRVTAEDGAIGEQHLRDFQDNEKTIPTILTTSQKLSTGVDARNVRHIVLMRPIRSMIEFKQIIGRGTRTYDGKDFFTVWDFVKAHENFNDPEWDGEPLPAEPPDGPRPPKPDPDPGYDHPKPGEDPPDDTPREKIVVKLSDGKARTIRYIASTTYWSPDGKPISAAEFLERLFGDLTGIIADEDRLRAVWSDPDNREHFLAMSSLGRRAVTSRSLTGTMGCFFPHTKIACLTAATSPLRTAAH